MKTTYPPETLPFNEWVKYIHNLTKVNKQNKNKTINIDKN